ncbi:MAG: DUF424 domain-containing protein [Candidatus Asgardarchaeia archaeon]
MAEVYLNVIRTRDEVLVAVCDKELLGKKFKEGDLRLHVTEKFYQGVLVGISEALKEIENCTIANLVGERIVTEAINAGLLHKDSVIYIQGIPHVQIVKM